MIWRYRHNRKPPYLLLVDNTPRARPQELRSVSHTSMVVHLQGDALPPSVFFFWKKKIRPWPLNNSDSRWKLNPLLILIRRFEFWMNWFEEKQSWNHVFLASDLWISCQNPERIGRFPSKPLVFASPESTDCYPVAARWRMASLRSSERYRFCVPHSSCRIPTVPSCGVAGFKVW